ncbi:hypothetical protein L1987_13723 [Smallanthus sonchifolius]|uniref:Uncharacterized protein n=1 Tax=Smallanthus sonchifolius TaxID=185202 RepID=A0ACB9JJK3_9ASTR|nr:hypothetical protein L1987_13723 [Smallanthus sonchifolius]
MEINQDLRSTQQINPPEIAAIQVNNTGMDACTVNKEISAIPSVSASSEESVTDSGMANKFGSAETLGSVGKSASTLGSVGKSASDLSGMPGVQGKQMVSLNGSVSNSSEKLAGLGSAGKRSSLLH